MNASPLHLLLLLVLVDGGLSVDLNQTCKKIVNGDPNVKFTFCITTLQAVPESASASLEGLGLISMNLTKANVTATMGYTKGLLKGKMRPMMRSCLMDCLDLYSEAISSLENARNEVKLEHYYDANIEVSATMDAPVDCEDGFKEKKKKGLKSPLSKRNGDLFELSAIVLSIVNLLSQNRI